MHMPTSLIPHNSQARSWLGLGDGMALSRIPCLACACWRWEVGLDRRQNHDLRTVLVVTWTRASGHIAIVRSHINQQLGTDMSEATIYCEVCWTNPGHAHIGDVPVCSQCIEEFELTSGLVYFDKLPYETLNGQRIPDAETMGSGEIPRFNPRHSEQLSLARSATLVGAF